MCGERSWKRWARTFSVWLVSNCASAASKAPVALPARSMAEQILSLSNEAIAPLRLITEVGGRTEEADIGDPFPTERRCQVGSVARTRKGEEPRARKHTNDPTVHPARGRFVVLRQVSWLADRCGNPVFPPRSRGSDLGGLQLFAHSCGGSAGMVERTGPASHLAPYIVFMGNRSTTDGMPNAILCQCGCGGKLAPR
jgi:hypothetical protein